MYVVMDFQKIGLNCKWRQAIDLFFGAYVEFWFIIQPYCDEWI